jgi:CheY-like chemotaxis protein
MLGTFLQACGAIVFQAHGGLNALYLDAEATIDAVVADLSMPQMDGSSSLNASERIDEARRSRPSPSQASTSCAWTPPVLDSTLS